MNSTGVRQPLCLCLPWPFDLMSMSRDPVHMWPNFGEISSNIYEDIALTQILGSLSAAVALTFDLWSQKLISSYEPKYICDQNWVKFPTVVFEICCSQGFRDTQTQALTHSLTHRWTDLITKLVFTFCWFRSRNRRAFGLLANLQPPRKMDHEQPYV